MNQIYKRVKDRRGGLPVSLGEVCTGIASEGGEVVEEWRKHCYENKPLYNGNIINEMADVLHYLVLGCDYYNIDLNDLVSVNMAKMDAIDAGERKVFDSFFEDWEPEIETIEHKLEQWDSILKALRESGEYYAV